jgi:DNA-binding MarR family transcriptional regulator
MNSARGRLTQTDYAALAELRYVIRRFLNFSEATARAAGVEPQQHQLLLAIRGLRAAGPPTIGVVAARLQIKHHSAVELVGRAARSGLVRRTRSTRDGREVTLLMTQRGRNLLARLSLAHRAELRSRAPALLVALQAIVAPHPRRARTR